MKSKNTKIFDNSHSREKIMHIWRALFKAAAIALLLSSCAVTPKHLNDQQQDGDSGFARNIQHTENYLSTLAFFRHKESNANDSTLNLSQQIFVRGDILRINVIGMEQLNGLYQVNSQGLIELPFGLSVTAAGLTRNSLLAKLSSALVNREWFYHDYINIEISLVRLATINVTVAGAVFNSGRVSINNKPVNKQDDAIQQRGGSFSPDRDLVSALQAAGGVRPDADLSKVYLKRGTKTTRISIANLLHGYEFVETPPLINGDEILVVSTNVENPDLIKPSQLTPPGMRVLLSNLTAPALNNAQSAVGSDSTRLPYGSSLLDATLSANCVGGTQSANASRSVVFITRNYGSNKQLVIKRSINQLLANSSDKRVNPYLMPNDGVACYDSRFTNFRDVARGVREVVSPFIFGGLL